MANQFQYNVDTLIDAMLDEIESQTGTSAHLIVFDGSIPASCATADAGSTLATLTLPSDWMSAASAGSVAKTGTWQGTASGTGTAQYFRIKDSSETTTFVQGTIDTASADMIFDNTSVSSGQTITISTFTITGGNA